MANPGPISVDQFHAMMQAGILTEDDRVELLEGALQPGASIV
jgi:hypothetical protein